MPDQAKETTEQTLQAEIARLHKIIQALMNRAESSSSIQSSDFNLFQAAIMLEDQVRRRTNELEVALRENEKITRALQESEDHYRAFFLGSKVPMLLIEPTDGRIVNANAAAENFYGYSPGQLKAMNIGQINTLTREEIAREMFNADLNKKSCFHFRHRLADGKVRDVEVYSGPVILKDHHVLYSIVHDITERKQIEAKLYDLNRDFVSFLENASDFIYFKDENSRFRFCSQTLANITGHASWRDMIGKHDLEVFPEKTARIYYEEELPIFKNGLPLLNKIDPYYDAQGKEGWVSTNKWPVLDGDGKKVIGLFGISRDITKLRQAEENLRITASVFDNSQEGIIITDANNVFIDVNPAFTQITGYSREEVIGKNPKLLGSGRQDKTFYAAMWQSLKQKKAWRGEVWNRRKSGEMYAELLSITAICGDDEKVQRYVGVFSDISHLKEHEAELDQVANYDALTGIPNRRLLADRMDQAIARAQRSGKMLSVCYIDLDGFKLVNDLYGHNAGDQLLVEITHRLHESLRAGDTLARLGGDEFVVLFNELASEQECFQILDRILDIVAMPVTIGSHQVAVSASLGVTFLGSATGDGDTLLRQADQAMYVAKQTGKNRYHLYRPEVG